MYKKAGKFLGTKNLNFSGGLSKREKQQTKRTKYLQRFGFKDSNHIRTFYRFCLQANLSRRPSRHFQELNEQGYTQPNGKRWSKQSWKSVVSWAFFDEETI